MLCISFGQNVAMIDILEKDGIIPSANSRCFVFLFFKRYYLFLSKFEPEHTNNFNDLVFFGFEFKTSKSKHNTIKVNFIIFLHHVPKLHSNWL